MNFVKSFSFIPIGVFLPILIFSIYITVSSIGLIPSYLVFLFIMYVVICIILLCTKQKIELNRNIIYSIYLLNIQLFNRILIPDDITLVKFKRIGWNQKSLFIKINVGNNIRVNNYKPESIYDEIEKFVRNNDIKAQFSKDYKYLNSRTK